MPRIEDDYNSKQARHLRDLMQRLDRLYEETVMRVLNQANGYPMYSTTFRVTDYPSLDAALAQAVDRFVVEASALVLNGVNVSWGYSALKLGELAESKYGGVSRLVKAAIENPQAQALEAFKRRLKGGLNISDRVWQIGKQVRAEIEKTLYVGISTGTSANALAEDLVQYLREPNRLDAAVLEAAGEFELSRQAKEYRPGQGIYRTSIQNAQRLARNEINGAYRESDVMRWRTTPFVLGYKTRLSNRHPKYDICDPMANLLFPTSFTWSGWHVQCLCSLITELAGRKEFMEYEDALLAGRGNQFKFKDAVTQVPAEFMEYVKQNMPTYKRWAKLPTYLTANPSLVPKG